MTEPDIPEMTEEELDDANEQPRYAKRADGVTVRVISDRKRWARIRAENKARDDAFLKKLLGPDREGWIVPRPGADPYEGLADQLFQVRSMIRHALPDYFDYGIKNGLEIATGIARLMQVSAAMARVLKQGAPKTIELPALDVTDSGSSKTVHGGPKVRSLQD